MASPQMSTLTFLSTLTHSPLLIYFDYMHTWTCNYTDLLIPLVHAPKGHLNLIVRV